MHFNEEEIKKIEDGYYRSEEYRNSSECKLAREEFYKNATPEILKLSLEAEELYFSGKEIPHEILDQLLAAYPERKI